LQLERLHQLEHLELLRMYQLVLRLHQQELLERLHQLMVLLEQRLHQQVRLQLADQMKERKRYLNQLIAEVLGSHLLLCLTRLEQLHQLYQLEHFYHHHLNKLPDSKHMC
jgi:hypothetical protein